MNSQAACKWIRRASTGAALTYTAVAEYQLARRLGAAPPIAVMLPVAIDCYVIAALKWFRPFDVALSLSLMGAAQVAAHALDAGVLKVSLQLVAVVSLLAPIALWRTHALARGEAQDASAEVDLVPSGPRPMEGLDVIQALDAGVPGAYPAIEAAVPAVPEAVPAGVRLLPIVARPEAPRHEIRDEIPVAVLAAEPPRTRAEVRAEYVPARVPEPVDEDELTAQVRKDWATTIAAGMPPAIRQLREQYGIGQARAQRIRDDLQRSSTS